MAFLGEKFTQTTFFDTETLAWVYATKALRREVFLRIKEKESRKDAESQSFFLPQIKRIKEDFFSRRLSVFFVILRNEGSHKKLDKDYPPYFAELRM
ncbi:hypothetical protein ABXT06_05650 [Flavobacterium sp. UW10123]|uniref:hypothetical protein n=1 Tax=Flavobacterium sp. UW10123 TaxID=3230800 RepID=UPI003397DB5A